MQSVPKTQGFTLIEIAIVLTVIALIVGGVLGAQSVIRNSEIKTVAVDSQRYLTAIQNFKQQYKSLPGDFPNATTYWGIANGVLGNDTTCYTYNALNTTGVCNGNGNGLINESVLCFNATCVSQVVSTTTNEDFGVWRHLASAGLISGTFTNTKGTGLSPLAIGTHVPASKIPLIGYTFSTKSTSIAGVNYTLSYGNALFIGSKGPNATAPPHVAAFRPKEAASLDQKMDDGIPGTGKWIASLVSAPTTNRFNNVTTACTQALSETDYSKPYNVTADDKLCSFIILSKL